MEKVTTAWRHSLPFVVVRGERLVAFARVVTDFACFAYLADVFVMPDARGQGVATRLIAAIVAEPQLKDLRRFLLATRDAHALYARHGFTPLGEPQRFMERRPEQ